MVKQIDGKEYIKGFSNELKVETLLDFLGLDMSDVNLNNVIEDDDTYSYDGTDYKIIHEDEVDDFLEPHRESLKEEAEGRIPNDLLEYFDSRNYVLDSYDSLDDVCEKVDEFDNYYIITE